MKKSMWIVCFGLSSLIMQAPSFAQAIGGNGGEGVEAVFTSYRQEIESWVRETQLQEINTGSLSRHVLTSDLLRAFSDTVVSFTDEEIRIGDKVRTCRNFAEPKRIECNRAKFLAESEGSRYLLVFHEYLGVVKAEQNDGASSTYPISSQIRDFFETKVTYKLSRVRKQAVSKKMGCTIYVLKQSMAEQSWKTAIERTGNSSTTNAHEPHTLSIRLGYSSKYAGDFFKFYWNTFSIEIIDVKSGAVIARRKYTKDTTGGLSILPGRLYRRAKSLIKSLPAEYGCNKNYDTAHNGGQ